MGRYLATECDRCGGVLDWGDFGPDPDDSTVGTTCTCGPLDERPLRVLVTGGRDYRWFATVRDTLDPLRDRTDHQMIIVQGGAPGADEMAREWAYSNELPCVTFPARWVTEGDKGAGPRRNQRMLDWFHPHVVVAFPGGRGTQDMKNRARKAGVLVIEVTDAG